MSLAWFHQQAQQQRVPTDLPCSLDANKQQRQLIAELESKNRLGMAASEKLLASFLLKFTSQNEGISEQTSKSIHYSRLPLNTNLNTAAESHYLRK